MLKQFMRFITIICCIWIVLIFVFIAIGNSRDNDVVSFTAVVDNRTDLYIYDPISSELTNITDTRFSERSFGWSNTGALFYTESGNPARRHDGLFVMNRIGDARLIETPDTLYSFGTVWSPDGHTLAYFSSHPRNFSDIYTISFPDATVRNLTQTDTLSENNPLWSPDGEHLIYDRDGNLYLLNIATGERLLLADMQNSPVEEPVWSPDGQFIVFYTQTWRDDRYISHAFIISRDGNNMQSLNLPMTINSPVTWSPDGEGFALIAEDTNLLIYDIADNRFERIEGENRRSAPAWSPDGRWIAFIENRQLNFYDLQTEHILNIPGEGRIREPLIWRP